MPHKRHLRRRPCRKKGTSAHPDAASQPARRRLYAAVELIPTTAEWHHLREVLPCQTTANVNAYRRPDHAQQKGGHEPDPVADPPAECATQGRPD